MTTESRFERDLTTVLEDLYLGPSPDYRDEVMAAAVRTRQRPSWTFAGRWLPMADIASRPVVAPRVPWRTVGMALLIMALALAAAALIVGSRQTKVPPPFGLARNGLITYAIDGDIHTLDPETGRTTAIVTGPENDFDPVFSPDGTRVAFRRDVSVNGSPAEAIVVVAADGSNPVVITSLLDSQPGYTEWAPDSLSILVEDANGAAIWELDATSSSAPRLIATDATMEARPFRPPNGDALLIYRTVDRVHQVVLLDLATGHETVLVEGYPGGEIAGARWSPSGDRLIYVDQPADAPDTRRLLIVNADGTGEPTEVPGLDRNHYDIDPAWSHDGTRIAFTRYEQLDNGDWDVRPVMLYTIADGSLAEIGPRAREVRARAPSDTDTFATAGEGLFTAFSPDAKSLIAMPSEATGHAALIDLATGDWRVLDALVKPEIAANVWQRQALDR